MKSSLSLFAQFRSSWPAILLILAISTAFISAVLFIHFWKGASIGELTRDPVSVLCCSLYIGFLSQIGIFFWAASSAVCIFSAYVSPRNSYYTKLKSFLFAFGLLSLVLGIDDVFLLHEVFFPYYIGVQQEIVYIIYVGFTLFFLVKFHSIILKSEYILLGMALGFFGVSVALDIISSKNLYIFEDGAKLIGLVSWLVYFFRFGVFTILHNASQRGTTLDENFAALHRRVEP